VKRYEIPFDRTYPVVEQEVSLGTLMLIMEIRNDYLSLYKADRTPILEGILLRKDTNLVYGVLPGALIWQTEGLFYYER